MTTPSALLDALSRHFLEPEHWNLPAVVSFWRFMLNNFTYWGLYTWVFYVLVLTAYFLGGGIFAIVDFFDLAPKYKIQPAVPPRATRSAKHGVLRVANCRALTAQADARPLHPLREADSVDLRVHHFPHQLLQLLPPALF